jgi:transglutaminase-like putative cysteine protease
MSHLPCPSATPDLPGLFADSVLGLYLDEAAPKVFALGRVQHLAPGMGLAPVGHPRLQVVLDGRLAGPSGWYGPGNHFSDTAGGLAAMDVPARVWSLDLAGPDWQAQGNRGLRMALARALIAADTAEASATPPAVLPDPTTLCDIDHPEITRRARRLRRATPASTAEAILQYVQPLPYRFGPWQERASDTLARGVGMCTTKANLQVALMRAAGLDAGFVESPMPTSVLGKLMPDGWLALQRPVVKHYFAAVKLGGRWHAADASYDDASYGIYVLSFPHTASLRHPTLAEGRPYAPAFLAKHADPWAITAVPHLNDEMGKRSRFQPRHFEALNTRLDRARGLHRSRVGALPEVLARGEMRT